MCLDDDVALWFFAGPPRQRYVTQPRLGNQAEVETLASARTRSSPGRLGLEADVVEIPDEQR
jgi:hypothetical protein